MHTAGVGAVLGSGDTISTGTGASSSSSAAALKSKASILPVHDQQQHWLVSSINWMINIKTAAPIGAINVDHS